MMDMEFDIQCLQYMALESTIACDPEDYGLPDEKKYPMPDKKHVLLAIKFFNSTEDPEKQKILAANINKRIKDFNMESEVNVGDKNRFKKYWKPSNEAVITAVSSIVPYTKPALKKAESVDDPLLMRFPIKKKKEPMVANESFVFNTKDDIRNFDKWKPGPNNILYITGLSGSGKTTSAYSYANDYNATLIKLDDLEHMSSSSNVKFIRQIFDKFPDFKHGLDSYFTDDNGKFDENAYDKLMKRVIRYLIELCHKDSGKLYIIEGIQLYRYQGLVDGRSVPIIIKGTSAISSEYRAIKRAIDLNSRKKNPKRQSELISNHLKRHLPMNLKDEKKLKEFKSPILESTLKSDLDADYKSKGNLSLSNFKKVKVSEITKEMKESPVNFLKLIDDKQDTTYIWKYNDDIVGVGSVRYIRNNDINYNWITAVQVNPKYRGYGLGNQILDFCVKELNGNALTVATDNQVALRMYKKYGFKISNESLADVKAGRRKVYFMYLNTNDVPNFPIIKSKNKYLIKDENGKKIAELGYYDYSKKDFNWILFADIETDKAHRNQGLGSKLLNRAYSDVIKDNPKNGVYLMVRPDNKAAISFYKKNGFEFVKSVKLKDGNYDLMCKGNADKNQLINMNYS